MPEKTVKIETRIPVSLLTKFNSAVDAETGMKHGRAGKIRALIREYVKKQGV